MSNPLNTYTLLLKNTYTKQVYTYTLQNISSNVAYYMFEFEPNDLPVGEYSYYLIWNTLDTQQAPLTLSNDILDSYFTTKNGIVFLRDALPDTGILKVIDTTTNDKPIQIDTNKNYITL